MVSSLRPVGAARVLHAAFERQWWALDMLLPHPLPPSSVLFSHTPSPRTFVPLLSFPACLADRDHGDRLCGGGGGHTPSVCVCGGGERHTLRSVMRCNDDRRKGAAWTSAGSPGSPCTAAAPPPPPAVRTVHRHVTWSTAAPPRSCRSCPRRSVRHPADLHGSRAVGKVGGGAAVNGQEFTGSWLPGSWVHEICAALWWATLDPQS